MKWDRSKQAREHFDGTAMPVPTVSGGAEGVIFGCGRPPTSSAVAVAEALQERLDGTRLYRLTLSRLTKEQARRVLKHLEEVMDGG